MSGENEKRNEAVLWTPDAVADLNVRFRNIMQEVDRRISSALSSERRPREKDVRVGVTVGYDPTAYDGAGAEDPAEYPDAPANTFWVKLAAPEYPKTPGDQELTVTPYDPEVYRLAHSMNDQYYEEGSTVWLTLQHGQYFIIPQNATEIGQGRLQALVEGYDGLIVADILVEVAPCSMPDLIGQVIEVTDHSECVFDRTEEELLDVWVWFGKGYTDYLGCHWVAHDRCCVEEDYLDGGGFS